MLNWATHSAPDYILNVGAERQGCKSEPQFRQLYAERQEIISIGAVHTATAAPT